MMSVGYGPVRALRDVTLKVPQGACVAVLGGNGAGKSTLLRAVSRTLQFHGGTVTSGEARFGGRRISGLSADRVVAAGVCHVPEGRRVFARMTVADNLRAGALGSTGSRADKSAALRRVHELFPVLADRAHQRAGLLSGGEQQMLAMGRALMSQPKLLMLDEPSMGLSPIMMQKIMSTIVELKAQGTTILLVEQNAQAALSLADQGHVMEVGSIVLSGTGQDLLVDESVRKAYLGED
ncbi:ABC transporter ATP-binding protein [Streptomyces albidoflavus]